MKLFGGEIFQDTVLLDDTEKAKDYRHLLRCAECNKNLLNWWRTGKCYFTHCCKLCYKISPIILKKKDEMRLCGTEIEITDVE